MGKNPKKVDKITAIIFVFQVVLFVLWAVTFVLWLTPPRADLVTDTEWDEKEQNRMCLSFFQFVYEATRSQVMAERKEDAAEWREQREEEQKKCELAGTCPIFAHGTTTTTTEYVP